MSMILEQMGVFRILQGESNHIVGPPEVKEEVWGPPGHCNLPQLLGPLHSSNHFFDPGGAQHMTMAMP